MPGDGEARSVSALWRDRRFRMYWAGQTLSDAGDWISEIALPLVAITVLDASPGKVATLTAALWNRRSLGW